MADESPVQPNTSRVPPDAQASVRSIWDRLSSLAGRLKARKAEAEQLLKDAEAAKKRLDAEIARRKAKPQTPATPAPAPGPVAGPDPVPTPVPAPPGPPGPSPSPTPEPGGPPPAPAPTPTGPKPAPVDQSVILVHKTFAAGDKGIRFMRGTTLFWAPWGYKFDRAKLVANLDYVAASGAIDYLRIFAQVGGTTWEDRTIDPSWPDYWQVMEGTLNLIRDRGMRSSVTLLASANLLSATQRLDFVDRWATLSSRLASRIQLMETANESFANGPGDAETRMLTARLRGRTPVLVAASSPGNNSTGDFSLLAGGISDIAGIHWDRNVTGSGGMWRPVRQPWDYQFAGDVPVAWTSQEPIGIDSSVAADSNPERLLAAAGVCGYVGGTGYVLHTGAGIRGGGAADLVRGRKANLWEQPTMDACLRGLANIFNWLPAQAPEYQVQNQHWVDHPFVFNYEPRLSRNYAGLQGKDYICLPHAIIGGPLTFTVKAAAQIKVYRPETGTLVSDQHVAAGGTFTVSDAGSAFPDPNQGYSVVIRGLKD